MAKRTTTSTGTAKRTRKTARRSKTTRRAAATPPAAPKPVEAVAKPVDAAAAVAPAIAAVRVETAPIEPTAEQIAERAYFLSLERQGAGGPLDDWLQAERELRNGSLPV